MSQLMWVLIEEAVREDYVTPITQASTLAVLEIDTVDTRVSQLSLSENEAS